MTTPPPTDYTLFVELLQRFSSLSNDLALIEGRLTAEQLEAANSSITEYAVLQEQAAQLEARLTRLFADHPEWRPEGTKSIKTPYGTVSCREVNELAVPNEAVTIVLIEAQAKLEPENPLWPSLLRVKTELNREVIETLDEAVLKKLGVSWNRSEPITVKAFKADAAKLQKAAAAAARNN